MRWDIFGNKKLIEKLDRIEYQQKSIVALVDKLAELFVQEIHKLEQKQIVEIPLVKPIIRDAERAMKKEKKDKLEPDTINNLWKN